MEVISIEKHKKLIGLIIEKYGSRSAFANKMELSERSILLKLNGKREFKTKEIEKVCLLLNIKPEDIPAYFF